MTYRRIKGELQIDQPCRLTAVRGVVTETWTGCYRGCRRLDGDLYAVLTHGNQMKLVLLDAIVRAERLEVEIDAC